MCTALARSAHVPWAGHAFVSPERALLIHRGRQARVRHFYEWHWATLHGAEGAGFLAELPAALRADIAVSQVLHPKPWTLPNAQTP